MKSAFYDKTLTVDIRDVPIPVPQAGQVLIRTVVSGINPKDWKQPKHWAPESPPMNHGDDIAGYVEGVGPGVTGFHRGDRVAALHELWTPHGSFAEYSVALANSTFHLGDSVSFEEAATVPLPAMTAALGIYQTLSLPLPWQPPKVPRPLIVYGGASAVGAYAIKFASLSNIHPIIAVAGNGIPFVESLLDPTKGDVVVDYRKGQDHVVKEMREAAGDNAAYAFDAISEKGSITAIAQVLCKDGKIATVLTPEMALKGSEDPGNCQVLFTLVATVHKDPSDNSRYGNREFGAMFFPYIGLGLAQGWFSGHPYEVIEGGLGGVQKALSVLESGNNSARKLVIRINGD
ncbi:GroES-like protein [Hortaea werneckii]|nr:GroES-like protein [Hortaea werneckii]